MFGITRWIVATDVLAENGTVRWRHVLLDTWHVIVRAPLSGTSATTTRTARTTCTTAGSTSTPPHKSGGRTPHCGSSAANLVSTDQHMTEIETELNTKMLKCGTVQITFKRFLHLQFIYITYIKMCCACVFSILSSLKSFTVCQCVCWSVAEFMLSNKIKIIVL